MTEPTVINDKLGLQCNSKFQKGGVRDFPDFPGNIMTQSHVMIAPDTNRPRFTQQPGNLWSGLSRPESFEGVTK